MTTTKNKEFLTNPAYLVKMQNASKLQEVLEQLDFSTLNEENKDEFIEKACALYGEIEFDTFESMISHSISSWIESPSRSLFNILPKRELPKDGDLLFEDLITQTRILLLLQDIPRYYNSKNVSISRFSTTIIKEDGNVLRSDGEYGEALLKIREDATGAMDKIINLVFIVHLNYLINQQLLKDKKLPKKLYRGVRMSNINFLVPSDKSNAYKQRDEYKKVNEKHMSNLELMSLRVPELHNALSNSTMSEIHPNRPLISFTSKLSVAKYFAGDEGFIIEVPITEEVATLILASPFTDSRFAEADYVSKKKEEEYILFLSDEILKASTVHINSLDYFKFHNDPRCVELFDHDNCSAVYKLNGVNIKVQLHWISNTKNKLSYYNLDKSSWGLSSREFKNEYGFSPVITNKTMKELESFEFREVKKRW